LYETALITVLWNKLLQHISATSKSLQNPELCLSSGIRLLQSLKDFVTEVRDDFGSTENEASLLVGGNWNYQDEHRRIKKSKTMFDETSENAVVLRGRDNFIVNVLNTICDKLSVELNGRIKAYESVNSRFALFF
jgi:hypothetical protein